MSSVMNFVLSTAFFKEFLGELVESQYTSGNTPIEGHTMWRSGVPVTPFVVPDRGYYLPYIRVGLRNYITPEHILRTWNIHLDFRNQDQVIWTLDDYIRTRGFKRYDPLDDANLSAWWSAVGFSLNFYLGWRQDVLRVLIRVLKPSSGVEVEDVVKHIREQQQQEKFFAACRRVARGCDVNGKQLDEAVEWANEIHEMLYVDGKGYNHEHPLWGHVSHWFLELRGYDALAEKAFARDQLLEVRKWEQAARACLVIALNPGRVDKVDCEIVFAGPRGSKK